MALSTMLCRTGRAGMAPSSRRVGATDVRRRWLCRLKGREGWSAMAAGYARECRDGSVGALDRDAETVGARELRRSLLVEPLDLRDLQASVGDQVGDAA